MTLFREAPLRLTVLEDDGEREEVPEEEQELEEQRHQLMRLVQDRSRSMADRLRDVRAVMRLAQETPEREWMEFLMGLESMDSAWHDCLRLVMESPESEWLPRDMEKPAEQLLSYLLYRHLPGALDDGRFRERIWMCLLALELIFRVCALLPMEKTAALMEAARLFSGEIEYSDENIARILDRLSEQLQEAGGE